MSTIQCHVAFESNAPLLREIQLRALEHRITLTVREWAHHANVPLVNLSVVSTGDMPVDMTQESGRW